MPWHPVTLNDGHTMPGIAFETSLLPGPVAVKHIRRALDLGFRHLDMSSNAAEAGRALNSSLSPRSDFFVVANWIRTMNGDAKESLQRTLRDLGVEYVDLYLLNDPTIAKQKILSAWSQMEKLKEEGLTRSIGVKDFDTTRILELMNAAKIKPAVNQLNFNAYASRNQIATVELCKNRDIVVKAYNILSPATSQHELRKESLVEISGRVHASLPHIMLAWAKTKDVVPLLTRVEIELLESIIETENISLTPADVATLDAIAAEREERMEKGSNFLGQGFCSCLIC